MAAFARLIPFLTILVWLLALYQLYNAVMFGFSGQYAFAAFYTLFGFGGFVLGWALWSHRRKFSPPQ